MPKGKSKTKESDYSSYIDKMNIDTNSNQSRLSLVLGALIVLVVGVLVFNYFNRNTPSLGPSQTAEEQEGDVSPDNLPGKYTVKEGDTLFTIADKYYKDGYQYDEIAKANNMSDVNALEVGQKLEIPKLADASPLMEATPQPTQTPAETLTPALTQTPVPTSTPAMEPTNIVPAGEKGAAIPIPAFGPVITSDKYTVVEGDWLSTIAARAYNGDVLAYKKLAEANKITNPDLIYPGQTLSIPR